jgi:hypothetical protein
MLDRDINRDTRYHFNNVLSTGLHADEAANLLSMYIPNIEPPMEIFT